MRVSGDPNMAQEPVQLIVLGPALELRYPQPEDAADLLELARDPAVTRFFTWGPYDSIEQPAAYVASLPEKRDRGELLDFLVVNRRHGPVGVIGMSGLTARNRHATVSGWFARQWWETGVEVEAMALITNLAFLRLGLIRLNGIADRRDAQQQRRYDQAGFRREGILADWHLVGGESHDVVHFGLGRAEWQRSVLHDYEVTIDGLVPQAFRLVDAADAHPQGSMRVDPDTAASPEAQIGQESLSSPVFLCHSTGDKPAVRRLDTRLRRDGIPTWLDENDLRAGQEWDREIHRAVRSARAVLVLLSRGSITKAGYVQKEIRLVLDIADEQPEGAIYLIPARIEECDVPERLRRWQWVDLYRRGGYNRLLDALRQQ